MLSPSTENQDLNAIQTEALGKCYKADNFVLRDISLSIQSGERVALIGSNGSGKSTLLKCLIGLIPSTTGQITALGNSFSRAPSARQKRQMRQQIGFVFQYHGLVKRLSVLTNVVHGMLGQPGSWRSVVQMTAPKQWREDAMETLATVNLAEKALERADALSGGQQQRVAIARALVRKPKLIIADEPAASLDPTAGRDVMTLFSSLVHSKGITLLFTSHDMDHALDFSDRIIALRKGRLHFNEATRDVSQSMLTEVFDG